jgi:2-aminoadipate transaminase
MVKSLTTADRFSPADIPSSGLAARIGSSAIRDLLALTERPDVLSLAGGMPSPASFPVDAIALAAATILDQEGPDALQYAPTEGFAPLRSWIAARHPVTADPDQVLITNGSQQALELAARVASGPGDAVVMSDPGYIGAIQAFRSAGVELVGIPGDRGGLRVDLLADRLAGGLRPRLVYVVANFDNPTGATLTAERRHELARLADRYGFVILDDDPYGQLRWAGEAPAPLATLTDRVVTLGTTSKVLSPGLRVGWAVGPRTLVRELAVVKQSADLHTSSLSQRIAHEVLTRPGFLEHHLDRLRDSYKRHGRALAEALRCHLGGRLTFEEPDGGMFIWGRLREGGDASVLLPMAVERGVAFVPGAAFQVGAGPDHRSWLRLSFATAEAADLGEAARRLARAVASMEADVLDKLGPG